MRYWVVMPAAGAGRRFGGGLPKQHWPLADSTVLELALRPFALDPRCAGIALALGPEGLADAALLARLPPKARTVAGGAQRADSVLAGLDSLALQGREWVLVHDAARPCLSAADLERLLAADAADPQPQGALLAAPVTDTLKQADASGCCGRTVDRTGLWRALTPQMFRYAELRAALLAARAAQRAPTDDAEAMEWNGARRLLLVAAADGNIKITRREDLAVAAAILAARGRTVAGGERP